MAQTEKSVGAAKTYTLLGPDRRSYQSREPGALGGHRRSRIYGRLDCPTALRAIARGGYVRQRVFFADEATAIAAGYRPCSSCMREEYEIWSGSRAVHGEGTSSPDQAGAPGAPGCGDGHFDRSAQADNAMESPATVTES